MSKLSLSKRPANTTGELRPFAGLQRLQPQAAGIDIGAHEILVCVPGTDNAQLVRTFGNYTTDLHAIARWLQEHGIQTVAMESTGVYWLPLFATLEAYGFTCCLIAATAIQRFPGRKSDVLDCQWIQTLHSYGLLAASFRPDADLVALRTLLRHRAQLIEHRSPHILHMQKALLQMNIQLSQALSDITGETGQRIIRAIVVGERDPFKLAALRNYRCKKDAAEIAQALTGTWRQEHLFVLQQSLALFDFYTAQLQACDAELERTYAAIRPDWGDSQADNLPTHKPHSHSKNAPKAGQLRSHLKRIAGVDLVAVDGISASLAQTIRYCWRTHRSSLYLEQEMSKVAPPPLARTHSCLEITMSLKTNQIQPVPEETARVAHAAFPKGNAYLTLRDQLDTIFHDEDFLDLYPADGQPGLPPWRLALVTILQFRENLPDRQAAEAVRARIDWKYLLGLELTDPGFDFSVLSEFRARLLASGAEERLLAKLLERCRELELVKARGKQRTDATRVLAAIRVLNRLELVGETIRATLNELATVAPAWLQSIAPPVWYERYRRRIEDDRLPQSEEKRAAYAQTLGEDGFLLLDRLADDALPATWRSLPTVETLRLVLARHYERVSGAQDGHGNEQIRFKESRELPPAAEGIESPYDPDARYRSRYDTAWTGYLVHLTETCEAEEVHLITHVETTEATVHEVQKTKAIHQALVAKQLPPGEHFVDSAYVDAELLVDSQQQYGIELFGPTRPNPAWQAKVAEAYDLDQFEIDWDQQQVRCPQGKVATAWKEGLNGAGQPVIYVGFRIKDCQACAARARCTRGRYRHLHLKPRSQFEALQTARQRMATANGQLRYHRRAGIEGTISQGVRAFGLRCCRYRGLAKTALQHIATAAAINLDRIVAWLNEIPQAKTRISRFARLAPT